MPGRRRAAGGGKSERERTDVSGGAVEQGSVQWECGKERRCKELKAAI